MMMASVGLVSCDDYDLESVAYDDNMQVAPADTTVTPTIDPEWELELIPNIGKQATNVYVYKDLKYDNLFTRSFGWTGGHGATSVGLPGGDVLWVFDDSFFGTVNSENRARGTSNFPHNAIAVQKATNGQLGETAADLVWLVNYVNVTNPDSAGYFQGRTHLTYSRTDSDPTLTTRNPITGRVYRIADGTVVGNKLQLLWTGYMEQNNAILGRNTLATYSLDGDMPEAYYLPDLKDYYPQEGQYLYRESVKEALNTNRIAYGATMLEDDGHVYLYALNANNVIVARTTTDDLTSPWEYYIRDAATGDFMWQSTYPTTEEMNRSIIMANSEQAAKPWVFKDGDKYYMVTQTSGLTTAIYIYRSDAPYGPFSDQQLLFTLPSRIDKIGNPEYSRINDVNIHPELSRSGELVFSACTQAADFWDNLTYPGSADFFRPFFFRVFNWKSVFDE